ncbi:hypothetical protein ES692_07050 [Psychroserpens burtonensis]|uniref:Carboxypeptidase-like regulatory domain-containing protein n=1 Tax=Psychroserpens burtonensis TaxID=49278 RepID=A0A5C7B830_9FLAO|nr:hypothetical protein [Psychroserpens burtonensis]TXE18397.1 hypothetical protein ES692_07050 [Psychroserpens burtonensis]
MRFKTTFFITFFFCLFITFGQQKISGRVIGEDLEIGMGIKIFDNDTTEIGKTDFNGYFDIELQKNYEKIIFGGLGYEWTKIKLPVNCKNLEIILLNEVLYHYKSNRKIDRLRKKRFRKIPELHLQAYNQGLFKTEKPCLNQEFEPKQPDLDRIRLELKEFRKVNKNDFNELNIGDVIKIPFGIDTSENENEVRTYYSPCENCTEEDYDFVIDCEVIKKYKRKLTLELIITKMKNYDFLKYRGKIIKINSSFKYEMKYYEVIIE